MQLYKIPRNGLTFVFVGDLRDQMIHTRIIVAGLLDSHLKRRLIATKSLTLDQVIAGANVLR